jgi:hypothetical protein
MIEYYISTSDESSVKTELEMDYMESAPQAERPWLLWAFIKMNDVDETTLPISVHPEMQSGNTTFTLFIRVH